MFAIPLSAPAPVSECVWLMQSRLLKGWLDGLPDLTTCGCHAIVWEQAVIGFCAVVMVVGTTSAVTDIVDAMKT
jgi:hypothetical protein